MKRFVEGEDRSQSTLFPERLDDYIAEDNPIQVIDAFVDELDLATLGFEGFWGQVFDFGFLLSMPTANTSQHKPTQAKDHKSKT